ncbi:MAG: PrgI family protein [bacterium]
MRYSVPQFIDVEDKVVGPLTAKQFFYIIGGGVIIVAAFQLADFSLFLVIALVTAIFVGGFGFIKISGRPLQIYVSLAFKYFTGNRNKLFAKNLTPPKEKVSDKIKRSLPDDFFAKSPVKKSHLERLSKFLDIAQSNVPIDELKRKTIKKNNGNIIQSTNTKESQ